MKIHPRSLAGSAAKEERRSPPTPPPHDARPPDYVLEQYEAGATMRLQQIGADGQTALGLVVWQSAEEKLFIWLLQNQSRWSLTADNRILTKGTPTIHSQFDLSGTFDPSGWHTLRLVRSRDRLTVYLDGPEVLTLPVPSRPERFGLATRDAAAAFTSIWQTGLSPHDTL